MMAERFPKARRFGGILAALIVSVTVSSCAGPKTHTVNLYFHKTGQETLTPPQTVGVVPFEDPRPSSSMLGKRYRSDGVVDLIVLGSSSPAGDLTQILMEYLGARGIRVVKMDVWEPDPARLSALPEGIDLVFAGRIEALEVEARTALAKTVLRYRIRLIAELGARKKREVVTRSVEISPEVRAMRFNVLDVEKKLNEALINAFDRLLQGFLPTKS
jgi:hypothetical protein